MSRRSKANPKRLPTRKEENIWTVEHVAVLCEMWPTNTAEAIARALDGLYTANAVAAKARKLRAKGYDLPLKCEYREVTKRRKIDALGPAPKHPRVRRRTILNLREGECTYVLGLRPHRHMAEFCGAPAAPGDSYCKFHRYQTKVRRLDNG